MYIPTYIKKLVKLYPNDTILGSKIRELVNTNGEDKCIHYTISTGICRNIKIPTLKCKGVTCGKTKFKTKSYEKNN